MEASNLDRAVFKQMSYGLYIVTSCAENRLNGQIVNTVIQVTSDPARVAVIVNKNNLTHDFISESKVFGASVLDESATLKFIGLFGFRSGRDIDKFAEVGFALGSTGCPLVTENCLSWLEARVIDQIDVGTHTLFVGEVMASQVIKEGNPLTYLHYHTALKGKAHKQSPTYDPTLGK
jgi:ferric-chelate reductase [NAD(P)H]